MHRVARSSRTAQQTMVPTHTAATAIGNVAAAILRPGHFLFLFSRSVPCRRLPATMITISRIIRTIAACEL